MDEHERRERALRQLVTLDKLGEGTTPEAENARTRAKELRAKYKIPERRATTPPPRSSGAGQRQRTTTQEDSFYQDWLAQQRRAKAEREAEQERILRDMKRRAAEARAREAKLRAEAEKRWQERMADKDWKGRPLSEEERRKAQADPFTYAQQRDGRTYAEKQADMQDAFGKQGRAAKEAADSLRDFEARMRCSNPETFYDQGGEPRKRNVHVIDCDRCGCRLNPGEGTIMNVMGKWIGRCCEKVPGPRRKRPDPDER